MDNTKYIPPPPEPDKKLQESQHYWLYKVTRDAFAFFNNKNHPLRLGHIWNRWACEELSKEVADKFNIDLKEYPPLSFGQKNEIRHYIQNYEKQESWDFPSQNGSINFYDSKWENEVNFSSFIFPWISSFSFTKFTKNVNFSFTQFTKNVDFNVTIFTENAEFDRAIFTKKANFNKARFAKEADFNKARFAKEADFNWATFTKNAHFSHTIFTGNIDFNETIFTENAYFRYTKFIQEVDLSGVKFAQNVDFSNAQFMGNVIKFYGVKFLKPINTHRSQKFSFKSAFFQTKVNFSETEFYHLPDLTGTDFRAGINLDATKFPPSFNQSQDCPIKGGLPDYTIAARAWHVLQSEMEKSGYYDQTLEFFGNELEAKRKNPQTNCAFKWVLFLYKRLSDYGNSIARPFAWWLLGIFIFCVGYYCLLTLDICIKYNEEALKLTYTSKVIKGWNGQDVFYALKFSFKGAVPFVSDQTTFFDRMFENCDTYSPIPPNNNLELLWFPAMYGVHTLCSLICIFLFGLGVRNKLRLKQ